MTKPRSAAGKPFKGTPFWSASLNCTTGGPLIATLVMVPVMARGRGDIERATPLVRSGPLGPVRPVRPRDPAGPVVPLQAASSTLRQAASSAPRTPAPDATRGTDCRTSFPYLPVIRQARSPGAIGMRPGANRPNP